MEGRQWLIGAKPGPRRGRIASARDSPGSLHRYSQRSDEPLRDERRLLVLRDYVCPGGMRPLQSALSQIRAPPAEAEPGKRTNLQQNCGEQVSSTSVAVSSTHHAADYGEQRIVTLRIFNGNIHRLGLLAFCEAAVVVLALYAAVFIRFAGFSATIAAFEGSRGGPLWPRALVIAAVFIVALAALGLYRLRQRARFTAVFVRILIAMAVAQVALALIFYAAPGLDVGRGVMGLTGA